MKERPDGHPQNPIHARAPRDRIDDRRASRSTDRAILDSLETMARPLAVLATSTLARLDDLERAIDLLRADVNAIGELVARHEGADRADR